MMLSGLVILPLLGAAVVVLLPGNDRPAWLRRISLAIASGLLAWSVALGIGFVPELGTMQLVERHVWLPFLGLHYHLGMDGLSFPLLVLNNLLTLIAIWISDRQIPRAKFYYALIFLLNVGVSGAFLAQDVLLFFLFYELEIIPLYFLIAIWGGQRRSYAAIKFLLYTAISGFLLLAAFLGTALLIHAPNFDYEVLRHHHLPLITQYWLLGGLVVGFAIKVPFFPFHTWLPDAHVEASTPVSVLLAGVLLKLGTYGLLRFCMGIFPEAWEQWAPWLAIWAAISALYGASCAIAQQDMKKVVAYSSIAHMAFILLAAAAATPLSLVASELQMISHGLISALLFLLVGVVAKKTGSRDVDYLRGLLNPQRGLPIIGSLMILGVMASAGIPGMMGFIAEFLIFRGSFPIYPWPTLFCLVGTGLTAVYFLLMINKVFFGRLTPDLGTLPPVKWSERLPALVLALMILAFGLQPQWLTAWSEAGLQALSLRRQSTLELSITSPTAILAFGHAALK